MVQLRMCVLHCSDGQNDPSEGTTVQSLEVYKNAIENLTSEVKSLKHENTELKKDRDSIKVC